MEFQFDSRSMRLDTRPLPQTFVQSTIKRELIEPDNLAHITSQDDVSETEEETSDHNPPLEYPASSSATHSHPIHPIPTKTIVRIP